MTRSHAAAAAILTLTLAPIAIGQSTPSGPSALVSALMGSTPLVSDLEELTDLIGGRPTGSAANLSSVEWALRTFRAAGVDARKERFTMPARWEERSAAAIVKVAATTPDGRPVTFSPRVVAMPFSTGTPPAGTQMKSMGIWNDWSSGVRGRK